MKVCRLVRLEKTTVLISTLIYEAQIVCNILEKPDSFIKQGCYEMVRHTGDKYKNVWELTIKGHTEVLMHIGNTIKDTKGCLIFGMHTGELDGERAVLESKEAFDRFMDLTKDETNMVMFVENYFC